MPPNDQEFLKRLLATFKVEAQEHVGGILSGLLELDSASSDEQRQQIVETVFRQAHSLKGAARAVNLTEVETACQNLEGVFAALKRKEVELTPELLDGLHKTMDSLQTLLGLATASIDPGQISERTASLESLSNNAQPSAAGASVESVTLAEPTEAPEPTISRAETVRIATRRLESLLLQTEELLAARASIEQHGETIERLRDHFGKWKKQWARIEPNVKRLNIRTAETSSISTDQDMQRLAEFLEWNQTFIESLDGELSTLETPFERDRRGLDTMVNNLLADMKKVVMLPFHSVLDVLRKVVRDISRDQEKEVEFVMHGADREVDRRILEEMKDPLIHLVRNSVDHGIELPSARELKGKPRRGLVTMIILQQENKVELRISDDGAGIDLTRVKDAAIEHGDVSRNEANELGKMELSSLIFRSGVSTSPILTDISGRGLGLAIVQEKVEKLGGTVAVESEPGSGTTFTIVLPVTLSTFRGVVVRVAEQRFVVPLTHVERVMRVRPSEIKTVGTKETIVLDGRPVSFVWLARLLGLPTAQKQPSDEPITAIVLGSVGTRIVFAVDTVEREQEVLLKNLGRQLRRVRNIGGVTILGAGKIVPVLNVSDLIKSAGRNGTTSKAVTPSVEGKRVKPILVADDSITSRTLLKNILTTNGYKVETAFDGVDALTKIRSGDFSLVVSDVEMPRMNGFELTARLRSEKKFLDLPVVLVTALDSQRDREHGVDVGASAYIVKTSFDQSNLLEVVQRLI